MTSVKKIKVALLALVAALVIAIPTSAFADDVTYSVTINNDKTGHTYGAYQVFQGDLSGDTLSNIKWGKDIDGTAALAAIKEINTGTAEQPNKPFAACTDAASVAKVLEGFSNGVADQYGNTDLFAATVAPFLTDSLPAAQKCSTPVGGKYVISGLKAGYYLIRDTNDVTGEDAATKFILQVVKDQPNITPKSSWPTSGKGVDEDDDNPDAGYGENADYTIGQEIPYRLNGTLPDTYANYATYYYAFHDKASEGLDYVLDANGKVAVEVYVKGSTTPVDPQYYTVIMDTVDEAADIAGAKKYDKGFTVEFENLKLVTENATDEIYVYYKAKLNNKAVIGNPGNPNKSNLTFNNDSNNTGKGKPTGDTPEKKCIVFTYELDSTKIDKDDKTPLAGAEFVFYRFQNAVEDGANADSTKKMYALFDDEGKVTSWTETKPATGNLISGADGTFKVLGLDDGTYYLEETKAPAGHNLQTTPWEIVIDATIANNAITELKINNVASPKFAKGIVELSPENAKGSVLPSTGGIGTTIFTIVGIALIVAAAAIMVIRRRNAAAIQ